jgi:hypothetical protein
MKKYLLCALFVVASIAFVEPAEAQFFACFDWSCVDNVCSFDASCSGSTTSSATPLDYRWIFESGGPWVLNGSDPTITHTYGPGFHSRQVTLAAGFLFVGYYYVTCNVKLYSPIGPPGTSFSGTCSG